MAVEIVILSGSRQGEQLIFEGEQFRAGDEPACEIYFNPALDPGTRGRMVLFRHREDGWSVLPLGAPGLLLDYDSLSDSVAIRSGQVVRMSADGPDFSFRVVAASAARKAAAAATAVPAASASGDLPPAVPVGDPLATLSAAAAGPALVPLAEPVKDKPAVLSLAILVLAGIGLASLVLAVGWSLVKPSVQYAGPVPPKLEEQLKVEPPPETREQPPAKPQPKKKPHRKHETPPVTPPVQPMPVQPAPVEPAPVQPADPLQRVREAMYLLQVEQRLPDGSAMAYPQATCCAVSDKELLTTANVGCELLRFRAQKYKVYATRPQERVKLLVTEIRIRTDFIEHEADRQARRYCDLALLSVDGRLPSPAPIAVREDLGPPRLEEGVRFGMLGYPHDGNKITPHDQFKLESFEGRVFVVRALEPQTASTPLCLDLTAQLPANAYGFGVFTPAGKLLGLYNEPPGEEEAPGMKNLHVVTAVHPEFIDRGLHGRDERLWVEPKVRDAAASGSKP